MHHARSRLIVAAVTGAVLASSAVAGVSQAVPATHVPVAAGATRAQAQPHCVRQSHNAPWYKTIAPFEHADIQRTTLFACARFTGSMTGANTVKAALLPGRYRTPFNMATRRPGEMYVYGGCTGSAKPPALRTFIAKLQAGTGRLRWRTALSNARKNNELHLCGAVDVLANGDLLAISDHTLYKLSGGTGRILAKRNMPTGISKPNNSAFNGVDSFPGGTIIARSMNRPPGCKKNGYQAAASPPPAGCPGAPQSAPGSVLIAINPVSLKVLNWIQLSNNIAGRVTTTVFQGHRYIYVAGYTQVFRYEWTGKVIKPDPNWGPVTYVQDGQTSAGAVAVMNNWVTLSTNGNPTKVPMGVVAISQANDKQVLHLKPNPHIKSGEVSYYYAKVSVDPANSRIYVMDAGQDTASAVNLRNGKLSLAWQVKQLSNSYITLIGPKNRRVFVDTNAKPNPGVPIDKLNPGPRGANYTEQIQWRSAATGRLLAKSAYYPPASYAVQVPPGYGGLIYDILQNGHIIKLAVHPK